MAIGIQLCCFDYIAKHAKGSKGGEKSEDSRYCWMMTMMKCWENFEHWELPGTFSNAHFKSVQIDSLVPTWASSWPPALL